MKSGPVTTFYRTFIADGNIMMVTLAGAMSTGELGKSLAEMIRQGKISAISTTGANLEEDVFNLVGKPFYEPLPDYRDLKPEEEAQLRKEGKNRVTATAIPDKKVVEPVVDAVKKEWEAADKAGRRMFPHEYLYRVLNSGALKSRYKIDTKDSWMLAAAERGLPIICPGWEDSTLGNAFASACLRGEIKSVLTVKSGVEYMIWLAGWYAAQMKGRKCGFFQIGGGIAGDCPICVVPMLQLELDRKDVPLWGYFCQITDSVTSYGGYSGALPNEKITWGKLDAKDARTSHFAIESDASIVAPLIFAIVLGL
jgi:deoxyhypusine synthase